MRKPISLLTVLVLGLLASLSVTAQVTGAEATPSEPLSATISPSTATTIDVGQYVQFTASASGGAPPYSYQWSSNDNPIEDATSSGFRFAPNHPGTYRISVKVTDDTATQMASNSTMVTVNPWLDLKIEAGRDTTNVNQPVQITAFVSGGTPPYRYQWYYQSYPGGEPVASSIYQSFMFTPTSPGTYVIGLVVTDSLNATTGSVALPLRITVLGTPAPSSPPTPTPTHTATPEPTPTPSPSPTPQPHAFSTSATYPAIGTVVFIIAAIIATLALIERQQNQSVEKPKA